MVRESMTGQDRLLALVVVTLWGLNFVVIKWGLEGAAPLQLSALRFLFAALPAVFFIARPRIAWQWVLAYAGLLFVVKFSLLFIAIKAGVGPGLSALTLQSQVFFTIALAALVLGEKPKAQHVLGGGIALAGMVWMAAHVASESSVLGFALVVSGGLTWGIANIVIKRIGAVQRLSLVVWASAVAAPPLIALSLWFEGADAWRGLPTRFTPAFIAVVLFLAYPVTVFGYWAWGRLLTRYSAAQVGPYALLIPVVAMAGSALLTGEALPAWKRIGFAVVLAGLVVTQWSSPRRA
jgi:O-acetylserine/cysteine efflux transporter